ncbi:hypothetical protein QTP86_015771 [Hemibagrus guttatus]|nr:hypothetical protein QTP86_015771 [Hemibagrus guttatus]
MFLPVISSIRSAFLGSVHSEVNLCTLLSTHYIAVEMVGPLLFTLPVDLVCMVHNRIWVRGQKLLKSSIPSIPVASPAAGHWYGQDMWRSRCSPPPQGTIFRAAFCAEPSLRPPCARLALVLILLRWHGGGGGGGDWRARSL